MSFGRNFVFSLLLVSLFSVIASAANVCSDGTPVGACSVQKPSFCGSDGPDVFLFDDAVRCGCPVGMVAKTWYCVAAPVVTPVVSVTPVPVRVCSDGTPVGACSVRKLFFCVADGPDLYLVPEPARCGCLDGMVPKGWNDCEKAPVVTPVPVSFSPAKIVDDIVAAIRGFKWWNWFQ